MVIVSGLAFCVGFGFASFISFHSQQQQTTTIVACGDDLDGNNNNGSSGSGSVIATELFLDRPTILSSSSSSSKKRTTLTTPTTTTHTATTTTNTPELAGRQVQQQDILTLEEASTASSSSTTTTTTKIDTQPQQQYPKNNSKNTKQNLRSGRMVSKTTMRVINNTTDVTTSNKNSSTDPALVTSKVHSSSLSESSTLSQGASSPPPRPCLWTELTDIAEDKQDYKKRVIVTSSHGTAEGTSYLIDGNTTKITCGDEKPLRDIILSDPNQNSGFTLHRIDCPVGVPLVAGSQTCPAILAQGQHATTTTNSSTPPPTSINKDAKKVICLAPLYQADRYKRWLMEYVTYHMELGFDHIVIPNFGFNDQTLNFLREMEKVDQGSKVRIVPWDSQTDTPDNWLRNSKMYERGKLPAWNRCYLEYQETAEYMLFVDIDEVLGIKTNTLQEMLDWMDRKHAETGQMGFSIMSRAVLSVLDQPQQLQKRRQEGNGDNKLPVLLLEQYTGLEKNKHCRRRCGEFHTGRWKYFIKGHGGKAIGKDAAPMPELLWTHSIGGLDYDRAKEIMALIPETTVGEVRHYQAHWYIHMYQQQRSLTPSAFQTIYSPLPANVLEGTKQALLLPKDEQSKKFAAEYKKASPGLSWALINNKQQPMPDEVLAVIRQNDGRPNNNNRTISLG